MAGDWIKMRMDLPDDPAVYKLALLTKLDRLSVVGRLYAFWAWADKHAVDGRVDGASSLLVDDVTRHDGFADALVAVHWLEIGDDYITIPRHERHNGESAKERGLKNARQARWRDGKDKAPSTDVDGKTPTKPSTREEKRREEKNKDTPKAPKGAVVGFEEFWTAYPRKDAKPLALKAFARVTVPIGVLLTAIARQKTGESWTKDSGKYIPMPASWLNAERWNDGIVEVQQDDESRDRIERLGVDKGIGAWDALAEQWAVYKARVLKAPHAKGFDLSQLAAMAAQKQGATA